MSNFWAKKIGAPAPQPVTQQNPNLPVGIGQNRSGAVQHFIDQRGGPYAEPELPDPHLNPNGQSNMGEAIWQWRGNAKDGAAKETLGNCPNCNSPRYTSRRHPQTAKMRSDGTMVYPAPRCEDCGYPSEQGSLGISASSQGPAHIARQGVGARPEGSLDWAKR